MKNILAENLLRFGVKNLKESDKQRLKEADPGDPSQSTVDLSADYASLKSALATYNSTIKSITGFDPGLFLRAANKNPTDLLITSATRQTKKNGDGYHLKWQPNNPNKIWVFFPPTEKFSGDELTINLDGKSIGSSSYGLWKYSGVNANNEKQVAKVKQAADTLGNAIVQFFNKVQSSVPKNYIITKSRAYDDGTAELIFGAAEQ
jgi:hypothetical protein